MGGRGKSSGREKYKQMDIGNYQKRLEVEEIKEKAESIRESINAGGDSAKIKSGLLKICRCCKEYTIPIDSIHYICPICGWIDDQYQNYNPDSYEGPNELSLNEARKRYFKRN